MFPPRLGTLAQTEQPPDDFWPPRSKPVSGDRENPPVNEPAMLLRLAGVATVMAIIIATALIYA